MKYPNPDMLLYIAMADAYAAAVEYNSTLTEEALKFERYLKHPTHGLEAGMYTDDTEMSVANARALVEHSMFSKRLFANYYMDEFNRGGRRNGYARGFQKILEGASDGADLQKKLNPASVRNGAAMRAAVIGVVPELETLLEIASLQAEVTHNTPEGIFSAQAVALMAHYAMYNAGPLDNIGKYCLERMPKNETLKKYDYIFEYLWPGGPITTRSPVPISVTTVHAVADLLETQNSLMDMLRQTILWGGDTDSVASIAWGIASARYRDEKLPEFMERDLEGGSPITGASYLRELGNQLMQKFS